MFLVLAILFVLAVFLVCYVVDMIKMLRDPDKTNEFVVAWFLFWMIDDE